MHRHSYYLSRVVPQMIYITKPFDNINRTDRNKVTSDFVDLK